MIDNHLYNLMNQLVEESKSLKRINDDYKKDAGDCAQCQEFWSKMQKDKEDHINELRGLIKDHMTAE